MDARLDDAHRAFERPPGIVEVEICSLSGLLPTLDCPHTRKEMFIAGTEPKLYDDWYQRFSIDSATGLVAGPGTPQHRIEAQVHLVLPKEAREWARQQGWPEPPGDPAPTSNGSQTARLQLVMTRPDPGSVFRLSPNLPLAAQRIEISARAASDVDIAEVTLYVNGLPLASFRAPPYRTLWRLEQGEHTFMAQGRTLSGQNIESESLQIMVREE